MQLVLDWLNYLQDKPTKYILWLHGGVGVGKTHLACVAAILWSLVYDVEPAFSNWAHRLGEIKDSFGGKSEANPLAMEEKARFLVLDDLGTERVTHFNLEALYRVIETRRARPTIITSNCTPQAYAKRIAVSDRRADNAGAVKQLAAKLEDRLQAGPGGYIVPIKMESEGSYRRTHE